MMSKKYSMRKKIFSKKSILVSISIGTLFLWGAGAFALQTEPSAPPFVMISANPNSIPYNTGATIQWEPQNSSTCFAFGGDAGWSAMGNGVDAADGLHTYASSPLTANTTFSIRCTNSFGTTPNTSVTVTTYYTGTISANPHTCAVPGYNDSNPTRDQVAPYTLANGFSTCASTINWSSNAPTATVFVSGCGQGVNTAFSTGLGANGSKVAPWVDVAGCTFDLRETSSPSSRLLAQLPDAPNRSGQHNVAALVADCNWRGNIGTTATPEPLGAVLGKNITVPHNAYLYFSWTSSNSSACRQEWDGGDLVGFTNASEWQGPFDGACTNSSCSSPPPGRYVRAVSCYNIDQNHSSQAVCTLQAQAASGPVAPTVSIFWAPSNVNYGSAGTIYWNTANATRCTHSDPTLGISFDDTYKPGVNDGWFFNTTGWPYGNRTVNGETWTMSCWNGATGPVTVQATLLVTPPPPAWITGSCPAPGTSATMNWAPTPSATAYALRVDNTTSGGWNGTCNASAGDYCADGLVGTSYTDTSFPGASYTTWVHACNAAGCNPSPANGSFVCASGTGCAYGTDSDGSPLTVYTSRNILPQDRRIVPGGKYKIDVASTDPAKVIQGPNYCFRNSGALIYFVPLGSFIEFDSFWSVINFLPGLEKIPEQY